MVAPSFRQAHTQVAVTGLICKPQSLVFLIFILYSLLENSKIKMSFVFFYRTFDVREMRSDDSSDLSQVKHFQFKTQFVTSMASLP